MESNNQTEVAKFAALAENWWDRQGPVATLHQINPLRLEFITRHSKLLGTRVLDVGCGGGILSEALTNQGARVTGLDKAAALIAIAEQHAQAAKLNIHYCCMDISELSPLEKFDIITCMELLEHVDQPFEFLTTLMSHLKPNGVLYVSTINRNLKSYLQAIIAAEYLLKLLPKGTHDYMKFIKPSEIASHLRQEQGEIFAMTGMTYNPLWQTFKLCQDTSVNYILAIRKISHAS